MSERDARLYLNEIVESCEKVARYIQDLDEKMFLQTELYQDAVVRNLEVIGEAAGQLSNQIRARYPDLPWKRMIGFRNIAIHAYFAVDYANVWHIAYHSLPELKPRIKQILDNLGDSRHLEVNTPQLPMISVHRARVEEIKEIRQVLSETWIDTYSVFMPIEVIQRVTALWHKPETLAAEIENPNVYWSVAKDEQNAILGLVTALRLVGQTVTIGRLYVSPTHQRRGIGAILMNACIAAFPGVHTLSLEVEAQNAKGLSFYRKQGFKEIARKEHTIEDITLMTIEMEKRLSGQQLT